MHIYKITNTVNNKIYIGQTTQKNPKMRWYDHCARARGGQKNHLYNSMRLYGIDKFLWVIIDSANPIDELNQQERHWLDECKKNAEVYNVREAGGNKKHSAESIEKMRTAQLHRHATTKVGGWKRRDGGAMKGKSHPRKGTKGLWHWYDEQKKDQSKRMSILNGTRGKTWKLIDGKRVYLPKEIRN